MDDLAGFLESCLDHVGIHGTVKVAPLMSPTTDRATADLERGRSRQRYTVLHGTAVPLAVAAGLGDPVLVVRPFVSTRSANALRRAGVQYVDGAGNAWIHFGDVLVDVRGRVRQGGPEVTRHRATNLFSSGRAQVVFALLAWPHLWTAPQRALARAAGVSVGQAHNTVALLRDVGFDDEHRRHARPAGLLDLWAAAFPSGLAERLALGTYAGDPTALRPMEYDGTVYISGEAATREIARSAMLVVYVEELTPRLVIHHRWRTDGDHNVVVRRKFWSEPGTPEPRTDTNPTAPWPLVYADLLASDDPRGRSAAQHWREQHDRAL